jgi:phosphoserine phosphatase
MICKTFFFYLFSKWYGSFAFGDSYYNHDILNLKGNPVTVTPYKRLREIADKKDWAIMQ